MEPQIPPLFTINKGRLLTTKIFNCLVDIFWPTLYEIQTYSLKFNFLHSFYIFFRFFFVISSSKVFFFEIIRRPIFVLAFQNSNELKKLFTYNFNISISVNGSQQSIVIEKTTNHNFTVADIRRSYTLPCMYVGKPNSTLVSVQWYMGNNLLYYRQDEEGRSKMTGGNTAFFKNGQ